MKRKIEPLPCPACGGKESSACFKFFRECDDWECGFSCNERDWNRLSLAVQAAEATRLYDLNCKKYGWAKEWIRLGNLREQTQAAYSAEVERQKR